MMKQYGSSIQQDSEEGNLSTSQVVDLDDVMLDNEDSREIRIKDMNSDAYPQLNVRQRDTSL